MLAMQATKTTKRVRKAAPACEVPKEPEAPPPVVHKYTVPIRAKPSARDNYTDAWLSEPLQEFVVTPEEARRRTERYFTHVKPGRYLRAYFKDGGMRTIHEDWIEPPKAEKKTRVTKRDRQLQEMISQTTASPSLSRHRAKEMKVREAAAKVAPVVAAKPVKPEKPKRGAPRRQSKVLRSK